MICDSNSVSKIRPEIQGEINMENGKGHDQAVRKVPTEGSLLLL